MSLSEYGHSVWRSNENQSRSSGRVGTENSATSHVDLPWAPNSRRLIWPIRRRRMPFVSTLAMTSATSSGRFQTQIAFDGVEKSMTVLDVISRPAAFVCRRRLLSNFIFSSFHVQIGHADALSDINTVHSARATTTDEMNILDALAFGHWPSFW